MERLAIQGDKAKVRAEDVKEEEKRKEAQRHDVGGSGKCGGEIEAI